MKITTLFLLTWAFWAYIIEVAFEQNSCPKAKNKNRFQNNSTLHMKGSVLLAVTDPFTLIAKRRYFFTSKRALTGFLFYIHMVELPDTASGSDKSPCMHSTSIVYSFILAFSKGWNKQNLQTPWLNFRADYRHKVDLNTMSIIPKSRYGISSDPIRSTNSRS